MEPPSDPYIYHHKWLFVADDYDGFDVEESKARSGAWLCQTSINPVLAVRATGTPTSYRVWMSRPLPVQLGEGRDQEQANTGDVSKAWFHGGLLRRSVLRPSLEFGGLEMGKTKTKADLIYDYPFITPYL